MYDSLFHQNVVKKSKPYVIVWVMVESQVVIRSGCRMTFLSLGDPWLIFDALMPFLTNLQFSQFLVDFIMLLCNLKIIASLMTILS